MAARDLASASVGTRTSPLRTRAVEIPRPPSSGSIPPPELALKYRTLFVIGRGGMGTVEAALQLDANEPEEEGREAYQRVVALKRLLPDAARDSRRVEMFLREARLAALLDHPNVVRAFDYGEASGELFLALEYIEGQTLAHLLRALHDRGRTLDVSLVAYLLAEVCEGLHAAHELRDPASGQALSLVHRDVSPQNMMISYDGHVRLLDFGVAKIEAESVTKTGEVKGKTAYMSPEQAMGDAIDRRSDLFGVGAVLFECLAGKRMWGDGTDMEIIRKLALEKPPQLEDSVPGAPPELCVLYTRLVAVEAAGRPANAHDVAQSLRAHVTQGSEAAARELRKVLADHFHDVAEAQHQKLTARLEAVAPDQARVLRESVSPDPADYPKTARTSIPAARQKQAPTAAPSRKTRWIGLVAFAIVIAVLVAWKISSPPATARTIPQDSLSPVNVPVSVPAPVESSALSQTPAVSAPPPPSTSRIVTPPPASTPARITAQPSVSPRASVSPLPAAPSTTAPRATAPPPSAKPPPDVDERPF